MDSIRYTELLERAKAESDRRIKAIFDSIHTFFILTLIDGTVIEINNPALAFCNVRREEVTGSPLWEGPWLAGDAAAQDLLKTAMEAAAFGEPRTINLDTGDSTGEVRKFLVTCQPVFGNHDDVLYVVVEAHDVTEFLRVQQRNRQLELELMQNHKMESLGTLASGVAHEINSPIQYIRDNLNFLSDNFGEIMSLLAMAREVAAKAAAGGGLPEARACLDAMQRADLDFLAQEVPQAIQQSCEGVERVSNIVQAIKLFSRADTVETKPESLEKLVSNTLMVASNHLKYVARVATDFQPDMPLVPCHGGEISQVILNLVLNAAHAIEDKANGGGANGGGAGGKEGGAISIVVRTNGANAEIAVTDTGIGIDDQDKERVFDLFFTTKDPGRGSGHGLSICQTIVSRKHGGALTFRSQRGVGTTFVVALPLVPPARPPAPPTMEP